MVQDAVEKSILSPSPISLYFSLTLRSLKQLFPSSAVNLLISFAHFAIQPIY